MADCAACKTTEGLQVCLFCGRSCCSNHRAESGGVTACTGCLALEKARSDRIRQAATVGAGAATGGPSGSSTSDRARRGSERAGAVGSLVEQDVDLRVAAPPPLAEPDPPLAAPLALAVVAAVPSALYLDRLLGWVVRDEGFPAWVQLAGTLAGAAFVLVSVWVIARSRLSR